MVQKLQNRANVICEQPLLTHCIGQKVQSSTNVLKLRNQQNAMSLSRTYGQKHVAGDNSCLKFICISSVNE